MLLACPYCRSVLEVPPNFSGGTVCYHCRNVFSVENEHPPASYISESHYEASLPSFIARDEPVLQSLDPAQPESYLPRKSARRASNSGMGDTTRSFALVAQVVLGGLAGLASAYGAIQYFSIGKPAAKVAPDQPAIVATSNDAKPTPRIATTWPPPAATLPRNNNALAPPAIPQIATTQTGVEKLAHAKSPGHIPATQNALNRPIAATSNPAPANATTAPSDARFIDQLPSEIVLPPKTQFSAKAITDCSALPGDIRWQVLTTAADIPENGLYFFESDMTATSTWTILYSPDATAAKPATEKIARVSGAEGKLLFQWANTAGREPQREQLRNCLLKISHGEQSRVCQLRGITLSQGSAVDFALGETTVSFELEPLARLPAVFLEMEPSTAGSYERDLKRVISGKELIFGFSDLPGAQVQTRMVRLNDAGTLQIKMATTFEESRGTSYKLTYDKLQELTKRWTEGGQKATLQLAEAHASIVTLQNQISYLSKQTGGDGAAAASRVQAASTASGRLRTYVERLPTLKKRVVEMATRLENVPKVKSFMDGQSNTTLHYRIYAEVGEHRLMLVDASR